MKKVASIITITTRNDFYLWLNSLPSKTSPKERDRLAEKAKGKSTVLWASGMGFIFWE